MSAATILIVEDEAVVAADLCERLERNGYNVCGLAASSEEAVALARLHRPDLALMDITLRGERDGIETARLMRSEFGTAIVFLSAAADREFIDRAKAVRPQGYLIKPFDDDEVLVNIEMALQSNQTLLELAAANQSIRVLNKTLDVRSQVRVTELRRFEALGYALAHSLRSPLRSMEGFSHLLLAQDSPPLDESGRRFLEAIRNGADRMTHLLDDLISFFELRHAELLPAVVEMTPMVRSVAAELTGGPEDYRTLELTVDPLPDCFADYVLVRHLVTELLKNALKFSRDSSPSKVRVGSQPGTPQAACHTYFVSDNGIGFDAGFTEKMFAPYSQLNLAEEFEGTGSGLAAARQIAFRLGGEVWAQAGPSGGATMLFTLPVAR